MKPLRVTTSIVDWHPRVGSKPAPAREESADEQPHSHDNLQEQNHTGIEWGHGS